MSTNYFILCKDSKENINQNNNNSIIHFGNSKSIHILPYNNFDYYSKHGLFEKDLIEWCKIFGNENKIFLDIGAHSGTYSLSLHPYFKEVHSFEPQKMTYYSLCGGVALSGVNTITCHNFGLGSKDQVGELTLNIVSNDGGGSTVKNTSQQILRTEKINIKTLDSLQLSDIGFIKIDVEENELDVLKGSVETLKRSNYPNILFESNYNNKDLFEFIQNLGYKIMALNNINNMFLAEYNSKI